MSLAIDDLILSRAN